VCSLCQRAFLSRGLACFAFLQLVGALCVASSVQLCQRAFCSLHGPCLQFFAAVMRAHCVSVICTAQQCTMLIYSVYEAVQARLSIILCNPTKRAFFPHVSMRACSRAES
jgi:hypothetical protein